MRIHIYDAEDKKKIRLAFPIFALKWRWVWNISGNSKYYPFAKSFYKAIKAYIKENGHFTLVEVNAADGDKIKITV